jgi:hypothetical protein
MSLGALADPQKPVAALTRESTIIIETSLAVYHLVGSYISA